MHLNWINYHHLYYFYQIAKHGGVVKAAKALRIGQPTLSTQLKQFEEQLGHKLFNRVGKSLTLTDAGKVALDYAEEIFQLGTEFLDTLKDQPHSKKINLQVGALDGLPKIILRKVFEMAQKKHPCFISFFEGNSEDLLSQLLSFKLDLVLTNTPAPIAPKKLCQSRLVGEFPVVIVGQKKWSSLKKNFPKSLEQQPFVLPTSHSQLRADLVHFMEHQGISLRFLAETQDTALQEEIVDSGLALTALSQPAAENFLQKGRSFTLIGVLPQIKEQLWITSAARKFENPLASWLMQNFSFEKNSKYSLSQRTC